MLVGSSAPTSIGVAIPIYVRNMMREVTIGAGLVMVDGGHLITILRLEPGVAFSCET